MTLFSFFGRLEGWKGGRVEGWKDGRMEGWKGGRMEDVLERSTISCQALYTP